MNYSDVHMEGDAVVRYSLIKIGKNPLVVLGVNPSTANEIEPDSTMRKVLGFADCNNYDSFIMVNVYPLRCTKPECLPPFIDPKIHQQNLSVISKIFSSLKSPHVLLAYGNSVEERKYLKDCLKEILKLMKGYHSEFYQIGGLTKLRHPRHPSRAAYGTFRKCNPDELKIR